MDSRAAGCAACSRDVAATVASLVRYWLGVLPIVRRELRHWSHRAEAIPDPILRAQAVATLREERLNAEAAAVFATLVPWTRWSALVPLLVAFQVMYDYLDTVSEERVDDPMRNGLQLHRALAAALDPLLPLVDWYDHHPHRDDGGYLDEMVAACRARLGSLPAGPAVLPLARRAAGRCAAGQSYTHAAEQEGDARLAAWALSQDRADGYRWWEVAAGAISSVGVYALLAGAADPRTTVAEAHRVDGAYFPPMCALSALLDSLVDRRSDALTDNHSSFGHYPSSAEAAERLSLIAGSAERAIRTLRHRRRHAAILAGVTSYYLSALAVATEEERLVAEALTERLGPAVRVILVTMRLRRRLGDHDD